jgi:hypothetical protein
MNRGGAENLASMNQRCQGGRWDNLDTAWCAHQTFACRARPLGSPPLPLGEGWGEGLSHQYALPALTLPLSRRERV